MRIDSSPNCRKCGGRHLLLLIDPRTKRLYRQWRRYRAVCRRCGRELVLTETAVEAVLAREAAGDLINHDLNCPTCGYNLRGLRVADRCPECGEEITSAKVIAMDALKSQPQLSYWLAAALQFPLFALAFVVTGAQPNITTAFVVAGGFMFIVIGVSTLVRCDKNDTWTPKRVRGFHRTTTHLCVVSIAVGFAFLMIGMLRILGVL